MRARKADSSTVLLAIGDTAHLPFCLIHPWSPMMTFSISKSAAFIVVWSLSGGMSSPVMLMVPLSETMVLFVR